METFEKTFPQTHYFKNIIILKKIKLIFFYLFASLFLVYFTFSATIYIPFYHHDSYKFSTGVHKNCFQESMQDAMGRPLNKYFNCLNYKYASTLERMQFLRLFCISWIAILITVLAVWLTTISLPTIAALFLSGSLLLLSALQTIIIMGATALLFAISTALLSFFLFQKSYSQIFYNDNVTKKTLGLVLIPVAWLIFIISMLTYPALSPVFLIPLFLMLFIKPLNTWKDSRKIIYLGILFFVTACFLYFLIGKSIQLHNHTVNYSGTADIFTPNNHLITRINTLMLTYSDFWNIHINTMQFWFYFIIIFLGIIFGFQKFLESAFFISNKFKATATLLEILITFLLLTLIGNVVILTSPAPAYVGRVAFPLDCMIVIILFWCLINLGYFFKSTKNITIIIISAIFFTVIAAYANYNVTTSALNDNLELNFIVSSIANYLSIHGNHFSRIHIIMPTATSFSGKRVVDDIYNLNSTTQVPDEFPIINTALLQLAKRYSFVINDCASSHPRGMSLQDQFHCVKHNPKNTIAVTYSRPNDLYFKSPHTILIDMNAIDILASQTKPSLHNSLIR